MKQKEKIEQARVAGSRRSTENYILQRPAHHSGTEEVIKLDAEGYLSPHATFFFYADKIRAYSLSCAFL